MLSLALPPFSMGSTVQELGVQPPLEVCILAHETPS